MKYSQNNVITRTYLKFLNKLFSIWGRDNNTALRGHDEPIIHCLVYESQQIIVVAIHIKQTHLLYQELW